MTDLNWDPIAIAWAAGIVEGEGCIFLKDNLVYVTARYVEKKRSA